ncbi:MULTISPECIES: DUF6039 family protein [Kitasatospora]|uniref:Uncharacterized protein n=1 Tax=Kitasatospora cystarginea TaxID=58350 RepID=A0ABN3ERA0_9ACTN
MAWSFIPPAGEQVDVSPDELMHSANSGLIIHRVGQLAYELRAEGRSFARDLQFFTNKGLHPYATTLVYEELFGVQDRMHWLIHMRAPNDYARLLEMVDHDEEFQEVSTSDRLTEKGGGNWEKMFVQGSFQERVIVPQHGLTHADEEDLGDLFAAPARCQTRQSPEQMLHSANAGVIIHRSGQVRFEFRKEARKFALAWLSRINEALAGYATVLLYEEQWGVQDRVHWLIHLKTLDDYRRIVELEAGDAELRELLTGERVPAHRGGGTWGRMFLDGSLRETVLVPHHPGAGGS